MSKYKQFKKWLATTPIGELRIPVLGWGCDTGMTLLQLSWTMTDEFDPRAQQLIDSNTAVIYAIYHGRMAGLLHLPGRERTSILISNSRDGEMVARSMLAQGFLVSRGSPTHGALQAAKSMLKLLATGKNVVVTVDGPRGPAMGNEAGRNPVGAKERLPNNSSIDGREAHQDYGLLGSFHVPALLHSHALLLWRADGSSEGFFR